MRRFCPLLLITLLSFSGSSFADEKDLAAKIRKLDPNVVAVEGKVTKEQRDQLRRMLSTDIRKRRRRVNEADVKSWRAIKTVKDWEAMRDLRIDALKKSIGTFPKPPKKLNVRITKTIPGDGFVIRNLAYESRPDFWVTANLYAPPKPRKSMPGILIIHSHHNPKEQSELQDMGMNWARAGCYVMVIDQIGHGERRQHPFRTSKDFPKSFRVSRQDYYFRYNTGIQLHLLGDSPIGWMAWDLMRGVDLLLKQPGIDPKRIILLGSVAGGGDPCAVTAAIDKRITAAVPFNFGGPQPENVFPLPKDAELSFNYMGGGSWESTRNISRSGRDGFLPWIIVGSVAPRRLVYAHEFQWDRKRDPVWSRFQTLYKLYGQPENLASTNGYGRVSLPSSKASHCNNIGLTHRKNGIYAAFEKWFDIPTPKEEYRKRLQRSDLHVVEGVTDSKGVKLTPMRTHALRLSASRVAAIRKTLDGQSRSKRREILQEAWSKSLGLGLSRLTPVLRPPSRKLGKDGLTVSRFEIATASDIRVPVLILWPRKKSAKPLPVVVGVAQSGKAAFLKNRSDVIAKFLDAGVAVCLPDLRGTGETRAGSYRGRRSYDTGLSSSELMLGGTMVGQRLSDLRNVLHQLKHWKAIDRKRIAIWGDSFSTVNASDRNVALPLGIDDEPAHSEPLGHLLALLTPLYEDEIAAVVSNRGGLTSFRSVLETPFVYVPHDIVIPGAIVAGDLPLLATAIAPKPLWIAGLTTGENKPASAAARALLKTTILKGGPPVSKRLHFVLRDKPDPAAAATWLIEQLH